MKDVPKKSSLSPARQRLIELMQEADYGLFRNLPIRSGDPLLSPTPVLIREFRLGQRQGPRPERAYPDFDLKTEMVNLFAQFDRIQNGTIETLEFKGGLPFRMFAENTQGQPKD